MLLTAFFAFLDLNATLSFVWLSCFPSFADIGNPPTSLAPRFLLGLLFWHHALNCLLRFFRSECNAELCLAKLLSLVCRYWQPANQFSASISSWPSFLASCS